VARFVGRLHGEQHPKLPRRIREVHERLGRRLEHDRLTVHVAVQTLPAGDEGHIGPTLHGRLGIHQSEAVLSGWRLTQRHTPDDLGGHRAVGHGDPSPARAGR
jgi:hypothetical protein